MQIAVRYDTANPHTVAAVQNALRFWSRILDMEYGTSTTTDCTIAVVDATGTILSEKNDVARSQFTDWPKFQGWIAFDKGISNYLSSAEITSVAIHELGHMFGLRHSGNARSVMYWIDAPDQGELDRRDMAQLRIHHALRTNKNSIRFHAH
jgi:predicted Zn-dependent protease